MFWMDSHTSLYLQRNGTNDHEHPRSVPFRPTRSNRVETHPEQSLGTQQQYEVDTAVVRVAIHALDYEHNHDA